jgi:hypothetical protein
MQVQREQGNLSPGDARPCAVCWRWTCSLGANSEHGLRRTNDDKRCAVSLLLHDAEWVEWSNREIARRCVVDHKTVAKLRAELSQVMWGNPQIGHKAKRNALAG